MKHFMFFKLGLSNLGGITAFLILMNNLLGNFTQIAVIIISLVSIFIIFLGERKPDKKIIIESSNFS